MLEDISLDTKTTFDDLRSCISKAALLANTKNSLVLELYYTGNGQYGSGDWCTFDKKEFSLINLLEAIKESGFSNIVKITTDCPYSGHWPVLAKKLWCEKHPSVVQFEGITVESSCDSETAIRWGAYRKVKEIAMNEGDDAASKYLRETHIPENGWARYSSHNEKLIYSKNTRDFLTDPSKVEKQS